jgi:NADH:ubiquinone oxidoreductase subunit K
MLQLEHVLLLSGALFAVGLYGVLARRNAVLILMSIELMLNAVNLNLVAFARFVTPEDLLGQVFAVFVITVAAAEVGLALGIILRLFRNRASINLDEIDALRL